MIMKLTKKRIVLICLAVYLLLLVITYYTPSTVDDELPDKFRSAVELWLKI